MSGFDLTVWWAPALAFAAGVVVHRFAGRTNGQRTTD